jgi:hypothetical protein
MSRSGSRRVSSTFHALRVSTNPKSSHAFNENVRCELKSAPTVAEGQVRSTATALLKGTA